MKVKKIGSKLIKPLTPTPLNLNNYKISFADKNQHPTYTTAVLFYESKPESVLELEESLAKTLVQFYPLAGRYNQKRLLIDCSDQGAEFVEAEALDVNLASIIGIRELNDLHNLNGLFAVQDLLVDESASPPLLSVQATRFACSGMAVAITISHRVFDGSSLSTFIAAWSSNTKTQDKIITPSFNLPSLLPCSEECDLDPMSGKIILPNENIVVKKLVFDRATLAHVRSKIGKPVSSARVAFALTVRAFFLAKRGHTSRGFRIYHAINMRERTIAPIPKHSCGNFSFPSFSRRVGASEAKGIGISELVDLIGESIRRGIDDHAEIVSVDRDGREIIKDKLEKLLEEYKDPDTIPISFHDWTRFGFYEADFGWGKPVWTSFGMRYPVKNIVIVMSNREGDGIEAWLHLKEDDMRCFESINKIISNL